jgi:diacylglycerol O-acyltransferase
VISNVPGPREALYFAGAKLDAYIPVSTISDGVGLNITVHSYENRLDFGLISDRELIPDLWHLVDLHIDEIARLFEATGAEWAVEPSPKMMRNGGDGVEAVPASSGVVNEMSADRAAAEMQPRKRTAAKKAPVKKKSAARKAAAKKAAEKKK